MIKSGEKEKKKKETMSISVPKESIEVIAQNIGINNLSPDIFPSLASDVEYRLREIMQVPNPLISFNNWIYFFFLNIKKITNLALQIFVDIGMMYISVWILFAGGYQMHAPFKANKFDFRGCGHCPSPKKCGGTLTL